MLASFSRRGTFVAMALVAASILAPTPASADCYVGSCYGAIAAGIKEGGWSGGSTVGIGSALNYSYGLDAGEAAILQCISAGGGHCTVVGTFMGCGYITQGVRGSRVGWGSGSTPQEAYNQCLKQEVDCDTPIGGCNSN